MTFEEFLIEIDKRGAILYWLEETDFRNPRLMPEVKRYILANGCWSAKLHERIQKGGHESKKHSTGKGRTAIEALGEALFNWDNPYIYEPKITGRRGTVVLDDLEIELEI